MTAVHQAILEIEERLARFAPEHEGLRDFARLNLKEATQAEIAAALVLYDQRVALLEAAKAACEALLADGHPDLPVREVSAEAFEDIGANTDTIAAAAARFAQAPAVTLTVTPEEPEDK